MFEYNFKLIKVVDGDTVDIDIDLGFGVWLKNQRIRLIGIDTPESRTRDDEEKKFGLLAKEEVIKYLANCKKFKSYKDEKGKFGRILGDFEVYEHKTGSWMDLSRALITNHHGVKYMGQAKDKIAEEHLRNRERLRELGLIE